MEAVIFALIGTRNDTFVPESSEFQPIDLRALRDSYNAEDNSPGTATSRHQGRRDLSRRREDRIALGRGWTQEGVSNSAMPEPEDVAGAVLLACKQSPGSRIIEIQVRTMAESLG